MPMDVLVQLIAFGGNEISKSRFHRPMPPAQEAFVCISKIGLCFFHYAPKRFENLPLSTHRFLNFQLTRQPHVAEHRYAHSLKASPNKRLHKLAPRLLNGNRYPLVWSRQHTQKICEVLHVSRHASDNGERLPCQIRWRIRHSSRRGSQSHHAAKIRGITQRSAIIAPICQRYHATSRCHSPAPRASPACLRKVVRIPRRPEHSVERL